MEMGGKGPSRSIDRLMADVAPRSVGGGDGWYDPNEVNVRKAIAALAAGHQRGDEEHFGGALFLIGAGCSRSANIPLGWEVAGIACTSFAAKLTRDPRFDLDDSDLAANHGRFQDALELLIRERHLPGDVTLRNGYTKIFSTLCPDYSAVNEVIRKALRFGRDRINLAHICLGQLVKSRYVHSVLTTNFDTLILDGIVRCGVIPAVADSLEALDRIRGRQPHPQLIHLHGSRHSYIQRNTDEQVQGPGGSMRLGGVIAELLRDSNVLFVVGYAGAEDGVMRHLHDAVERHPDKPIFWVERGDDVAALSDQARKLLAKAHHWHFLGGMDADEFFALLLQGLGIGSPEWIKDPVGVLQQAAERIVHSNRPGLTSLLAGTLEDYKARLGRLEVCGKEVETDGVGPPPVDTDQVVREAILRGDAAVLCDIDVESLTSIEVLRELARFLMQRTDDDDAQTPALLDQAERALMRARALADTAADIHLAEELATLVKRLDDIGDNEKALRISTTAFEIAEKVGDPSDTAGRMALGSVLTQHGIQIWRQNAISLALPIAERAVAVLRPLCNKGGIDERHELATALHFYSNCLHDTDNAGTGLKAIREAVEIRRELTSIDPVRFNFSLANSLIDLSIFLIGTGETDVAMVTILEALDMGRDLASSKPARFNPDLGWMLGTKAYLQSNIGDQAGALACVQEAISLVQPAATAFPNGHYGRFWEWLQEMEDELTQPVDPDEA